MIKIQVLVDTYFIKLSSLHFDRILQITTFLLFVNLLEFWIIYFLLLSIKLKMKFIKFDNTNLRFYKLDYIEISMNVCCTSSSNSKQCN